jgi:hypothetical protein
MVFHLSVSGVLSKGINNLLLYALTLYLFRYSHFLNIFNTFLIRYSASCDRSNNMHACASRHARTHALEMTMLHKQSIRSAGKGNMSKSQIMDYVSLFN